MDCSSLPGSSVHWIFQARLLEWLPFPSPGVPPTQGSNPGLLRCRQALYHLSHQGSLLYLDMASILYHLPLLSSVVRWRIHIRYPKGCTLLGRVVKSICLRRLVLEQGGCSPPLTVPLAARSTLCLMFYLI